MHDIRQANSKDFSILYVMICHAIPLRLDFCWCCNMLWFIQITYGVNVLICWSFFRASDEHLHRNVLRFVRVASNPLMYKHQNKMTPFIEDNYCSVCLVQIISYRVTDSGDVLVLRMCEIGTSILENIRDEVVLFLHYSDFDPGP